MRFTRIGLFMFLSAVLALSVSAQDTPSDVSDLVGARAAGGETQLKARGYKFIKVEEGEDRKWSNWWNGKNEVCITVMTRQGRYESIVSSPAFDCGKEEKTDSGDEMGGDTPSDLEDLVGARAAGGETQLKARGYKFIKVEEGEDRKWSNWWNEKNNVCVTVMTREGRYEAITTSPAFDCGKEENAGGDEIGANTPSDVADLVGARASSGETQLKSRGYRFIKVEKGDDRTWSNWWNARKKVCLTVVTLEGRYDSIVSGPAFDCNQK